MPSRDTEWGEFGTLTRGLNLVLLALFTLIGIPFYWYFLDTRTYAEAPKPLGIEQLRTLAEALPGSAPVEIRYERVGRREVISNVLAAGSGLRPAPYEIRAFQLVLPDGGVISIDRGISRTIAARADVEDFDPVAQAAVEQGIGAARLVLTLDPRPLHSGLHHAEPDFGSGMPDQARLADGEPYAVAPGIVVIPAEGVKPGTRMVYVRLEGGAEFLFTGDIAPLALSWSQQRPPARLTTEYVHGRNRDEIAAWLRTVAALKQEAPVLNVVAGHDGHLPPTLRKGFLRQPSDSPGIPIP